MKFLTIILATIVVFLSVKSETNGTPFQLNTEKTTCCGSTCSPTLENDSLNNEHKKGDCKGNSCNPFQACCSCFLFYIANTTTFSVTRKVHISTKQFFNYKSLVISQYITDFWQPPRIV